MDPITILALLGATTAMSFGFGIAFGRVTKSDTDITKVLEERDQWKEVADKYKSAAESHKVSYYKPKRRGWKHEIDYQYDSTIQDNLDRLREDLKKLKTNRVRVTLRVYVLGEWACWLRGHRKVWFEDADRYTKAPNWDFETPDEYDEFGRLNETFIGTPGEVADEIEKFLKIAHWGLWVGGCPSSTKNSARKRWYWARPLEAIRLKVNVETQGEPKLIKPEVKIVEVVVPEPDERLRREAEKQVEEWTKKNARHIAQKARS